MRPITVLVTGAGAPGFSGTNYSLKKNYDNRKVEVYGADCNPRVYGRYMSSKFFKIPSAVTDEDDFMEEIYEICEKHMEIDVIVPQVEAELLLFANIKDDLEDEYGVKVVCSKYHQIQHSSNKASLYEAAEVLEIPVPKYSIVETWYDLINYIRDDLDFTEQNGIFVVKAQNRSGGRGCRIIDNSHMTSSRFLNEKPDAMRMSLDDLYYVIGDTFLEPMIVSEYLPGDEYSVDVLSDGGIIYNIVTRRRDMIRTGITFVGTVLREVWLEKWSGELTNRFNLKYAHGYQFKANNIGEFKLLECNPRVQGSMVASTLAGANIIYGAIKLALEEIPQRQQVKWGTKFYRDWTGIGVYDEKRIIF